MPSPHAGPGAGPGVGPGGAQEPGWECLLPCFCRGELVVNNRFVYN